MLKTEDKMDESVTVTRPRDETTHYSLDNLILMFFIFSGIGWVWEVIYIGFTEGVIANRGMFHGPWLPIYGVGGCLILLLLGRFKQHPFIVFLLATLLCGSMEYLTAVAVEFFFRCRWWDYSTKFMNLHGRVCLEGLLLFGISGTGAVCKGGPALQAAIMRIDPRVRSFLRVFLSVSFVCDLILSFIFPNMGVGVTYALLK